MKAVSPIVTVEFYGVPRARAGRPSLEVCAQTVAEALAAAARVCPALGELFGENRQLVGHYLLSINGQGFSRETHFPLKAGDHVLLLSADAGG